ncbi:uncharacterized protein LOC124357906 [Homalodisca vitripennis]|uniref:uncharacterized protein LOC124357906 n=1 Tax=Homalodisca vitripennis TaxID=197043 RepID=UPI001EEC8193|nr:uncharacterized protein LOC124357906 [Homalodisca vitripennis]
MSKRPLSSTSRDESMEIDFHRESSRKKQRLEACHSGNVFVELKSAFRGILKTYYLKNGCDEVKDIALFLESHKVKLIELVNQQLSVNGAVKFNLVFECTYIKPLSEETQARAFKTKNKKILYDSSIDSIVKRMYRKISQEESEYLDKGSGWTLYKIDGILVRFSRYRPLRGSTYIPLPQIIENKKAVINPKNLHDNQCFKWAIISRYVKGSHRERVNNRYLNLQNKFNFEGISFPTPLNQVKKFEKNNPNVSVNVYSFNESEDVYPLKVCDKELKEHFDLLLYTNNIGISHYCYITNFSRLVRSQITSHETQASFCKRCFKHFQGSNSKTQLKNHIKDCISHKPIKVIMPVDSDDSDEPLFLSFSNFHYKYPVPIVAYCDFESILKKPLAEEKLSQHVTVKSIHEPMSFCVYFAYDKDSLPDEILNSLPNEPYLYRGPNASAKFVEYIVSMANLIGDLLDVNKSMLPLTQEEKERVKSTTHCECCNSEFTETFNQPCKDHCHLSGRFRSVLCYACNLKRQNQKFLPVVIHGSSNYDSHFIIKNLGCDERKVEVIPNSKEKYISFVKHTESGIKLRFVDSFRFMGSSLSSLVQNLSLDQFNHTKMFFNNEDLSLVTRKGVYPYEFTDAWEKLDLTQLPSKECFYNTMTLNDISE